MRVWGLLVLRESRLATWCLGIWGDDQSYHFPIPWRIVLWKSNTWQSNLQLGFDQILGQHRLDFQPSIQINTDATGWRISMSDQYLLWQCQLPLVPIPFCGRCKSSLGLRGSDQSGLRWASITAEDRATITGFSRLKLGDETVVNLRLLVCWLL